MAYLGALDKVYERIGAVREAIEQVSGVDPLTEDLLIAQSAELEMSLGSSELISDVDGNLATEGAAVQLEAAAAAYALQPGNVGLRRRGSELDSG